MNAVAYAQLTFHVIISKISILTEPVFKYMGQQMYGPDSSSG